MNNLIEKHEEEILVRMFQKELIGMKYTSIERVASKISWEEIARTYRIKKSFQSVMRRLINHMENKQYSPALQDPDLMVQLKAWTNSGVKINTNKSSEISSMNIFS